jgi:hypothetical protein
VGGAGEGGRGGQVLDPQPRELTPVKAVSELHLHAPPLVRPGGAPRARALKSEQRCLFVPPGAPAPSLGPACMLGRLGRCDTERKPHGLLRLLRLCRRRVRPPVRPQQPCARATR